MITYRIDYSIDYGEMKPLLGVDVYALGDHPSIAPPVPIIDDDDDDANEVAMMADDDEEKVVENDENDDAIDGGRRGSDDGTNGGEIPTNGKDRDDDEKLRSRSNDPEDEFDDVVMSDDGSDSGDGNPADDESDDADGGGVLAAAGEHGDELAAELVERPAADVLVCAGELKRHCSTPHAFDIASASLAMNLASPSAVRCSVPTLCIPSRYSPSVCPLSYVWASAAPITSP